MIRYDPQNGQGRDRSPPVLCLDIRIPACPPVKSRCLLRASARPWSSGGGQLPSAASALRRQNGHIMTSETTVSGTDHACIASGKPGGFLEKSHSTAGAATALTAIVIRVRGTVKSIFDPQGDWVCPVFLACCRSRVLARLAPASGDARPACDAPSHRRASTSARRTGHTRAIPPAPARDTNKRARTHFPVTKWPSHASDKGETAGTLWRVRRRASGCGGLASSIRTLYCLQPGDALSSSGPGRAAPGQTQCLLLLDARIELN